MEEQEERLDRKAARDRRMLAEDRNKAGERHGREQCRRVRMHAEGDTDRRSGRAQCSSSREEAWGDDALDVPVIKRC